MVNLPCPSCGSERTSLEAQCENCGWAPTALASESGREIAQQGQAAPTVPAIQSPRTDGAQRRTPAIHYLIAALLTVNLALTAWIALRARPAPANAPAPRAKPLPLNASARDRIFADFQKRFNSRDIDALYDSMSAYTRSKLRREHFNDQMKNLFKIFGQIESGEYSRGNFDDTRDGLDFFTIHYLVQFSGEGAIGHGTVRFTLSHDGNNVELVGVYVGTN